MPTERHRSRARRGSSGKALVGLGVAAVVMVVLVGSVFWWIRGRAPVPVTLQRCVATVQGQTASLSLTQAQNASIIAGVAVERGLPPRATTIALVTALQESDLINVDYGDRDSLGLFQQRPSQGWGTTEQVMDPHYSAGKFYDALVKVANWQTSDINDTAQAVQRSGYPEAYRQHVERAKILASALTGETGAAWSCLVKDVPDPAPASLRALFKQTFPTSVTDISTAADTAATPAVVRVRSTHPWAVAAMAQSHAVAYGVRTVRVGDLVWTVSSTETAAWVPATDPGQPDTEVTVGF